MTEELLQLRQEKSLGQERLAQRDELIVQMQQQAILTKQMQALQDQFKKECHNTHLLPSSDCFHRQSESLCQKSGKQAGRHTDHPGSTLMQQQTLDTVIVHSMERCQWDLWEVESLPVESRQVIDLPIKRVLVIEHQAEQKCCPACHQISIVAFHENVNALVQYGAVLGAVGFYLVRQGLLPYERACEVIQDLLGPSKSEWTLQALVQHCAVCLEQDEAQIKTALTQSEVLYQDELLLYVAGKRYWMHVSAMERLAHFAVYVKRGNDVLDSIGILKEFAGVSVHDGWQFYWCYPCQHGLCNVYHLRELIFQHEHLQQKWIGQM